MNAPGRVVPSRPASSASTPAGAWIRIGFAALFLGAVAVEIGTGGTSPVWRNLLADLGLAAILLLAVLQRKEDEDASTWRLRGVALALPAGVALLASCRSLGLPYLSDDWCHIAALRACATPLQAFDTSIAALFIRPVGWCLWWCLARWSPVDGTLAHAACVLLFMIDAVLVVLALKRCGATRGVAFAAAVCFAASPIASGTVAWPSNLYAILSTGFSLAAIACLPTDRASLGQAARTLVLAGLACLSKEDAFVLPILLVTVGAGFRLRGISTGIRLAAPAGVALLGVLVLRSVWLSGAGGYTDVATGRPLIVARWITGLAQAARSEFPTSYFQPLFADGGALLAKSVVALIPLALLGLGGPSAEARRQVPRALVLALVAFLPVVWTLPIGTIVVNARQVYMPSVFLGWMAAGLIAGFPFRPWFRTTALVLYVACSLVVGGWNHAAWDSAGRAFRAGVSAVTPHVAAARENARVLVYGLPEFVEGAPCFLNATGFCLPLLAKRPDVGSVTQLATSAELDLVVEFDPGTGVARDVTRVEVAEPSRTEATVEFDFSAEETRARTRLSGWTGTYGEGAWNLVTNGELCTVGLPAIPARPGSHVTYFMDAAATNGGRPIVPTVLLTSELGDRLLRRPVAPGETLELSASASSVRVEIGAPYGTRMTLRRIVLTLR